MPKAAWINMTGQKNVYLCDKCQRQYGAKYPGNWFGYFGKDKCDICGDKKEAPRGR